MIVLIKFICISMLWSVMVLNFRIWILKYIVQWLATFLSSIIWSISTIEEMVKLIFKTQGTYADMNIYILKIILRFWRQLRTGDQYLNITKHGSWLRPIYIIENSQVQTDFSFQGQFYYYGQNYCWEYI